MAAPDPVTSNLANSFIPETRQICIVTRDLDAMVRRYADELGRDLTNFDGSLHMMVNINDDEDKAFEQATTFLGSYYGAGAITRARAETWIACGSPQSVIDKIATYIEAGCTMPVMRFVSPDLKGQLQRCIEEVMPAFKSQVAAQAT